MPFHVRYYDDIDLGFLYERHDNGDTPFATFYPIKGGADSWRFIQPPSEAPHTVQRKSVEAAVRDFLIRIGVATEESIRDIALTIDRG